MKSLGLGEVFLEVVDTLYFFYQNVMATSSLLQTPEEGATGLGEFSLEDKFRRVGTGGRDMIYRATTAHPAPLSVLRESLLHPITHKPRQDLHAIESATCSEIHVLLCRCENDKHTHCCTTITTSKLLLCRQQYIDESKRKITHTPIIERSKNRLFSAHTWCCCCV